MQKRLTGPDAVTGRPSPALRMISASLLISWVLAMIAGRLIGYTSAIL
jgi:hypothetical protein